MTDAEKIEIYEHAIECIAYATLNHEYGGEIDWSGTGLTPLEMAQSIVEEATHDTPESELEYLEQTLREAKEEIATFREWGEGYEDQLAEAVHEHEAIEAQIHELRMKC